MKNWFVALCLAMSLTVAAVAAPPKFSSPGTKSSTSAPKPSTPKFSSPSTRSTPVTPSAPSRPPVTESKPKFSAPSTRSVAPTPPVRSAPSVAPQAPVYTPNNPPSAKARANLAEESKRKMETPSYVPPPEHPPQFPSGAIHDPARKPPTAVPASNAPISAKARANLADESKRAYDAAHPPVYVAPSGNKVVIDKKVYETVRSKPVEYYKPEVQQKRVVEHIHTYKYSRDYDWYRSQPTIYVGGGYSSAFWWMMMTDWSAQRRAEWLYHNQNRIERNAYEQGMRDAAVAAEIARLKAQGVQPNSDYVDPEFAATPTDMYDPNFVEAAYRTPVATNVSSQPADMSGFFTVMKWILAIAVIVGIGMFLTQFRFGR